MTFIHNPYLISKDNIDIDVSTLIHHFLHDGDANITSTNLRELLFEAFEQVVATDSKKIKKGTPKVDKDGNFSKIADVIEGKIGWQSFDKLEADKFWRDLNPLIQQSFNLRGGDHAIIVNGRVSA